jgi:hypothetical protein
MSADKNSKNNTDHSGASTTRVIVKSKKIGYFSKLFGKANPSTNKSIIIEKNGSVSQIIRINDEKKSYLSFSEKLLSIFGKYQLIQKSIDHSPFNLSYKFNKDDSFPLLTKDNQKISAFYSLDLQIDPINPVKILQSFPESNITIKDISKMLDQRIRSTTASAINDINSSTVRSSKFHSTFLNKLAPDLNNHASNLGFEVHDWTAPIFGTSLEEENKIEIENKKHELKIAELEKEISSLNESEKIQTNGDNINVGRDFIINSNTNSGLNMFLGIITTGVIISAIIYLLN